MAWGFSPHRHIHAKAWSFLPSAFREAWQPSPTDLLRWATSADSRKHTDTLEAARHYLDLDDLPLHSPSLAGTTWSDAQKLLSQDDSTLSPRRLGVLPWELERAYWRMVAAWSPRDSSAPNLDRINRAAADFGHYLADAHVPLHTSGNYDGQRTNQRGIHALWETQAAEWLLVPENRKSCGPCSDRNFLLYDPVWTPWEVILESHELVDDVLLAERQWREICQNRGHGFQRRGRTLALLPTPEALAVWDSLTKSTTWPRLCLASCRIAAGWHAAWVEAGSPRLTATQHIPWWEPWASYLPDAWQSKLRNWNQP